VRQGAQPETPRVVRLSLTDKQLTALVEAVAYRQELLRHRAHDGRLPHGERLRAVNQIRTLGNAQRELMREVK
jgi:hypothetical protein